MTFNILGVLIVGGILSFLAYGFVTTLNEGNNRISACKENL